MFLTELNAFIGNVMIIVKLKSDLNINFKMKLNYIINEIELKYCKLNFIKNNQE